MIEEKRKQVTEGIIIALYNEIFPMEDYQTAEYINGRKERAIKYYLNDSVFHMKVDTLTAYILTVVG